MDLLYLAGSSQPPYIKTYKLLFENSHLIPLHYKYDFIRSGLIAVLQHGHLELCRYLLEEKNINFADFKINVTEIIHSNEIRFSLTLDHIRYFLEKRLLADSNEELRNLLLCQNIQNVNYIDIAEYFKDLGCMLDKADLVEV
ncbi:MAG: hypothetical protein K0S11_1539 [Gammaproteobacteria bacterium]|nr:hypothetical protein [Gammaproteobacteria bacterium]